MDAATAAHELAETSADTAYAWAARAKQLEEMVTTLQVALLYVEIAAQRGEEHPCRNAPCCPGSALAQAKGIASEALRETKHAPDWSLRAALAAYREP